MVNEIIKLSEKLNDDEILKLYIFFFKKRYKVIEKKKEKIEDDYKLN